MNAGNGRIGDDGFDDDWVGGVDVVGSDVVVVVVVVVDVDGEVFFVVVVVVVWLVAGRFFIPPSSSRRSKRPGGGPRSGRVKVRLVVRRLEWQSKIKIKIMLNNKNIGFISTKQTWQYKIQVV